MQIDTYHLFIDYKAAFDSAIRQQLLDAMAEFGIPAKLIRPYRITLTDTTSLVKIGTKLTEPFATKQGFRQGDSLSCDFFKIIMEMIMWKAAVNRNGTIFNKSHMLLAYANDIDIIGHGLRDITAAFTSNEKQSAEVGLVINEDKTKLFVSTNNYLFKR